MSISDNPSGDTSVAENYRYWQENGGSWGEEYDKRKKFLLYYHIQEIMLCEYMLRSAPVRVLEYGCGSGRHLFNLHNIAGVDIHGYDQSQTMVDNCLRWTSREWLNDRVTVGSPTGRLPYPDGYFDIAYTSEVLIHVRPEDLELLLSELLRISSWQVFHMEPSPDSQLLFDHEGCWKHDLIGTYRKLGHNAELLPQGFSCQAPYRVVLDRTRAPHQWSKPVIELMRKMEVDVQPQLDEWVYKIPELTDHVAQLQEQVALLQTEVAERDGKLVEAGWTIDERDRSIKTLEGYVETAHGERKEVAGKLEQECVRRMDVEHQLGDVRRSMEEHIALLRKEMDERTFFHESQMQTLSVLGPAFARLLVKKSGEVARNPGKIARKLSRRS